LRAASDLPAWLIALWPSLQEQDKDVSGPEASPFLENFLIDAEDCWREGGEKRATSGPWIEQDPQGQDVQLEATALTVNGQSILLLERLGETFEAKKTILQKARETVIAYQRLNSEIQKKEILLHCVAEDMTAALANVITSLRLLELETNSQKGQLLLGLASRATEAQQALIHKVLAVFAEELSGLFGQNGSEAEADLAVATERALEATAGDFAEKKVRLISPWADSGSIKVALDPRHLEHVITNLIQNALERTPAGGEVDLNYEERDEAVILRVDDSGALAPRDACEDLFSALEPAAALVQPSILRLHFCRMTVENCGGEIGCGTRDGGGNRFWIRLPKVWS